MFNRLAAIRELKIMNSVWGVLLRLVLWIGTPVLTIWFYEIWWLPLTIGSILIFLIRPINMQQCADLEKGNSSDHEAERERREADAEAKAEERRNYEYFEELEREREEQLEHEHMNRVFNSDHWH